MNAFRALDGRTWTIAIDPGFWTRLQSEGDLWDIRPVVLGCERDRHRQARQLWLALDLDGGAISFEQFADSIRGNVREAAYEALTNALIAWDRERDPGKYMLLDFFRRGTVHE